MDDWLNDPLIFRKENSISYRYPKNLEKDACQLWESFHFSTRLKLEGADHFCRQTIGAASMPHDMGLPLLAHRQTKWYLDAFFFELMAAYDTLLQEMNKFYSINLDITRVKWENINLKLPPNIKDMMEKERGKSWFKRLLWYRNTGTHHAYIPGASGKGGFGDNPWDYDYHEEWIFCQDGVNNTPKKEEIKQACPEYLKYMLSHIQTIWNKMGEDTEWQSSIN